MSLAGLMFKPRMRPHVIRLLKVLPLDLAYYLGGRSLQPIAAYSYFGLPERGGAYLGVAARKRPELADLLRLDKALREDGLAVGDMYAALRPETRAFLFACPIRDLSAISKPLNRVGMLRLAGFVRAVALLRLGQRLIMDGVAQVPVPLLAEIGGSDYCDHLLAHADVKEHVPHERLSDAVAEVMRPGSFKRLSGYLNPSAEVPERLSRLVRGRRIFLQGPSVRATTLYRGRDDLVGMVGYTGNVNLPSGIEAVDISFLAPHKLFGPRRQEIAKSLSGLKYVILKRRQDTSISPDEKIAAKQKDLDRLDLDLLSNFCQAGYSWIEPKIAFSMLNAGVELFLAMAALSPDKLRLSGFDLFVNPDYQPGYTGMAAKVTQVDGGWRYDNSERLRTFGQHEPSQQFTVYKAFRGDPAVEYDSVLDDIVSRPLSEYLAMLEAAYRPAP